jgi:hypothetical protein
MYHSYIPIRLFSTSPIISMKERRIKERINVLSSPPLPFPTHPASRSALQSSVSTNDQPGASENVRLLLFLKAEWGVGVVS